MQKQRKTKTIRIRLAACVACTVGLCFSASASSTDDSVGPTANVWIDVVELSSEARVSVWVPISYGFAVLGTTETSGTTAEEAISTANGNLHLPNVRVEVSQPSSSGKAEYQLVEEAVMPFKNYSTDVREENINQTDPVREGLPVELRAYIVDSGVTGHFWQISSEQPTNNGEDFKKYRMILDGKAFSQESRRNIDGVLTPVVEISENIPLAAPPDVPANGYTAAGTANVPSLTYVPVEVEIGGKRGQYHQVEESVNVARIHWEVIPGELP